MAKRSGRRALSPSAFDRGVRCANGGRESSNGGLESGRPRARSPSGATRRPWDPGLSRTASPRGETPPGGGDERRSAPQRIFRLALPATERPATARNSLSARNQYRLGPSPWFGLSRPPGREATAAADVGGGPTPGRRIRFSFKLGYYLRAGPVAQEKLQWGMVLLPDGVLDGQTLSRLDRWRQARALFLRADGPEAERAVSLAMGRAWARAQVYGRARRLLIERNVENLLSHLESGLGPLAEKVRVAPEDPAQTKWDAIGNLTPLPAAGLQVRALWLLDVLQSDSLFVEFQPIFDLRSGETLGFEGLLRARLPDGSCRSACEIFPAARALRIERAFERLSWIRALEAAGRLPAEAILFLNVNPQLVLTSEEELSVLGAEAERVQFPYARLALDL